MTEYEKMIASQPYNCMAPELDLLRRETARLYRRFNRSDEEDEQLALLLQIVGELAQGAFICPPSTAPMAATSTLARAATSTWGPPCWTMPPFASAPR